MTKILGLLFVGSLVLLGGCAPAVEPLKPVSGAPNLIGEWKGQWGGSIMQGMHRGDSFMNPMTLVIGRHVQSEVAGNVTYFPHPRPPATDQMTGTVGARQDGSIWVYVTTVGGVDFRLKVISDRRLEGEGSSQAHSGPVVLTRE